jgi:hypothetical protein
MELGVYLNPHNPSGPLVLVELFMLPSIVVERLHGPLKFRGSVEANQAPTELDWQLLVDQVVDAQYTTVTRSGVGELILAAIAANAQQVLSGLEIQLQTA